MKRKLAIGGAALASTFFAWQIGYAGTAAAMYGDSQLIDYAMGGGFRDGVFEGFRNLILPTEQAVRFQDYASVKNSTLGGMGLAGGWAFSLLLTAAALNKKHPFGNARWARGAELGAMGVRAKDGFVLGKAGSTILRANDELHTLIVGPTRAGKGVGPITATALDWKGSMIVFDPKGEVYERTAGYRAEKYNNKVYQFRPLSSHTDRFNPLDLVRPVGEGGYTDIVAMADFLIPPSGNQPMWANEAKSLFVGLVGYVLSSKKYVGRRNLSEVQRLLVNEKGAGVLKDILEEEPDLPEFVRARLGTVVNMDAKATASGFITQARSSMTSFGNPRVAAATSRSDFDVRTIKDVPQTIYVTVSPDEMKQSQEMLRLVVQMMANVIAREAPQQSAKNRVLFVIDEFAKFGHMPEITDQLPLMSGYGVNIMLAVQDLPQLDELYGRDTRGDILANTGRKVYLGVNDLRTAEDLARQMGDRTVYVEDETKSYEGMKIKGRNKTKRPVGRPLMSADEIMRMSPDQFILLCQGAHPFLGTKLNVFQNSHYRKAMETRLPDGMATLPILPYVPAGTDAARVADGDPSEAQSPSENELTQKDAPAEMAMPAEPRKAMDLPPIRDAISKRSERPSGKAPKREPDPANGKADVAAKAVANGPLKPDSPSLQGKGSTEPNAKAQERLEKRGAAFSTHQALVRTGASAERARIHELINDRVRATSPWAGKPPAEANHEALALFREVAKYVDESGIYDEIMRELLELPKKLSTKSLILSLDSFEGLQKEVMQAFNEASFNEDARYFDQSIAAE